MLDTPCIIFAGGKSSRMGEDKTLLPFGGFNTLTEYQYTRLSKIFKNVYISCKDKQKFNFDANYIEDSKNKLEETLTFAPTLGFISIFKKLKSESFFAISVDTPFIDAKVIDALFDADKKENDATIAKTDKSIHPLCGIYHRSLQIAFMKMLETNTHKLGYLLKQSHTIYVNFKDDDIFLNLNHPHEYQKALKRIAN